MKEDNRYETKTDLILDELTQEYKKLLYEKVLENSPDIENPNLIELIKLDTKAKEGLKVNNRLYQRRIKYFSTLGLAYFLIGSLLYIYLKQGSRFFTIEDLMSYAAVLVAYAGLAMLLVAYVNPQLLMIRSKSSNKKYKSDKKFDYEMKMDVVKMWRELEIVALELSDNNGPDNFAPSDALNILKNLNVINSEDEVVLKKLLALRNHFVHDSLNSEKYFNQDSQIIIKKSKEIINKLYRIIN